MSRLSLTPEQHEIADTTWRKLEADPDLPTPTLAAVERMLFGGAEVLPAGRQMLPRPLSTVEPARTRWLYEGRIPSGALTILAGRQGLGKSTLLAKLAADLSRGELPGDRYGEKSTVLVVTFEDDIAATATPRHIAAGADMDCVVALELIEDGKPDLVSVPGDLDLIEKTAREYQAAAIFIDPLMAALPGSIDSHRDQDVRRTLAPLAQLAAEADLAIVAVLHLRKGAATEALDRVSGSVAFTAAARSVLAFGRAEDEDEDANGRILAHAKSNLGPLAPSLAFHIEPATVDHMGEAIPTSRLILDGETDLEAGQLLSPIAEDRTEVDVASEWLRDRLADGEWHPTANVQAAAKAEEIAKRTLQRAAKRIGVEMDRRAPEGIRGRGSAVGHWRLSDSRATAPGAAIAPSGWRDKDLGSREPDTALEDPLSRQGAYIGATTLSQVSEGGNGAVPASPEEEAEIARLAGKFGGSE